MVEGEVEVTLNDTLALEIASSGRFTGGCEVEEADISGVYEGDLTVRKHLCVRSTGKLTGTIRYSQLELERGGQIAGNISVISAEGRSGANALARGGASLRAAVRRSRRLRREGAERLTRGESPGRHVDSSAGLGEAASSAGAGRNQRARSPLTRSTHPGSYSPEVWPAPRDDGTSRKRPGRVARIGSSSVLTV